MAGSKEKQELFVTRDQKPYGDPLHDAMQTGDRAVMRDVAKRARVWLQQTESDIARVREALGAVEYLLKQKKG